MAHTDDDLEDLEDLLLSLPDEGMLLSEFDGFCAGLIVCPQLISPSEWLPLVLGDPASFDSPEGVQAVMDPIMAHYNRVARSLVPPASDYEAIYDADERTGETLWELWLSGFSSALALRPDCLDEIAGEEALQAVATYVQLHLTAEREEGLDAGTMAYLTQAAPTLIPEMVVTLNAVTKGLGTPGRPAPLPGIQAPSDPPFLNPHRKVGRNDPCPCGSGRKYKRCCGAN